jgi:hypothetical protein
VLLRLDANYGIMRVPDVAAFPNENGCDENGEY